MSDIILKEEFQGLSKPSLD